MIQYDKIFCHKHQNKFTNLKLMLVIGATQLFFFLLVFIVDQQEQSSGIVGDFPTIEYFISYLSADASLLSFMHD